MLIHGILPDVMRHGFFLLNREGHVVRMQTGAVRVNCIDSLDRTNVVQSLLAHHSLQSQLEALSVLQLRERYAAIDRDRDGAGEQHGAQASRRRPWQARDARRV